MGNAPPPAGSQPLAYRSVPVRFPAVSEPLRTLLPAFDIVLTDIRELTTRIALSAESVQGSQAKRPDNHPCDASQYISRVQPLYGLQGDRLFREGRSKWLHAYNSRARGVLGSRLVGNVAARPRSSQWRVSPIRRGDAVDTILDRLADFAVNTAPF